MTNETRVDPTLAFVDQTTATTQDLLRGLLHDVPRRGLDWPTPGFPNPPGWLAWHICRGIDRNVSEMQGVEQLWIGGSHADAFGRPPDHTDTGLDHDGDAVRSFSSAAPDDFMGYVDAVFARLRGFLTTLRDDDLDRTTTSATLHNRRTVRQRLTALCTEMLQHRGELAVTAAYAEAQTNIDRPVKFPT